jgi:hypothetical protein
MEINETPTPSQGLFRPHPRHPLFDDHRSPVLFVRHLLPVLEKFGIDSSCRIHRNHPRAALILSVSSPSVIRLRRIHSGSQGNCTLPHPCFIGGVDILV